jgi:hypothetical protein
MLPTEHSSPFIYSKANAQPCAFWSSHQEAGPSTAPLCDRTQRLISTEKNCPISYRFQCFGMDNLIHMNVQGIDAEISGSVCRLVS